jgi:hypothetical protein
MPRAKRTPKKRTTTLDPMEFFFLEGDYGEGKVTEAEVVAAYNANIGWWEKDPGSSIPFLVGVKERWGSGHFREQTTFDFREQ